MSLKVYDAMHFARDTMREANINYQRDLAMARYRLKAAVADTEMILGKVQAVGRWYEKHTDRRESQALVREMMKWLEKRKLNLEPTS